MSRPIVADADLVERARIERLIEARIVVLERVALATHACRADDARAAVRELRALLEAIELGEQHGGGGGA